MRVEIKDGKITAISIYGDMTYEVLNCSDDFKMDDVLVKDEYGKNKVIPVEIDEVRKTCKIIINPNYIEK